MGGIEEMKPRHPIQPLVLDEHGVLRFKPNAIVRWLVDREDYILNTIAAHGFSQEDQEQFAQLIGYSLSGYGDLSYVSNETYEAANAMSRGMDERDARIEALEEELASLKADIKEPVAKLLEAIYQHELEEK